MFMNIRTKSSKMMIKISNDHNNIGTLLFIIKAMLGLYLQTDKKVRLSMNFTT